MYTFLKPVTWQIAVRGTAIHLELLSRFIGSERPQWSAADKPNIQFSGSCAILPARAAVFPAARPALAPNRLPIHSSHRRFTKFRRLREIRKAHGEIPMALHPVQVVPGILANSSWRRKPQGVAKLEINKDCFSGKSVPPAKTCQVRYFSAYFAWILAQTQAYSSSRLEFFAPGISLKVLAWSV
jgi:hypothetical protein